MKLVDFLSEEFLAGEGAFSASYACCADGFRPGGGHGGPWGDAAGHAVKHAVLCPSGEVPVSAGCATQAAYGHADGFSEVRPPCDGCAELVATLPVSQVSGWCSFPRGDSPRPAWPSAALSGEISPAVA